MRKRGGKEDSRILSRVRWFLYTDNTAIILLRETVSSIVFVLFLGLLLFAISGLWPPMVAVESGSMQPEMSRGDLIFTMEEHRLSGDLAHGNSGVVTSRIGAQNEYRTFGGYGDVIIYQPNGDPEETPVIHRARFWVNDSENWYSKADPSYLSGDSCEEIKNCPAPHSGFITKGDANSEYDQATEISSPVRPKWIIGTAELRIPHLGRIRLAVS